MQINSLIALWPYIKKNGGIYIIEDIFTSFLVNFNDNRLESTIDLIMEIIIVLNEPRRVGFQPPFLMPKLNVTEHAIKIARDVMSVNCFERACALIKK